MYIRWLGAFCKHSDLTSSFDWELSQSKEFEVACEHVVNSQGNIDHVSIGLLIDPKAITKKFKGDCYSQRSSTTGKLFKTRNPKKSKHHNECWTTKDYTGIILKTHRNISEETLKLCCEVSKKYKIAIYWLLENGKFIKIERGELI
jgi:hypothetical protein